MACVNNRGGATHHQHNTRQMPSNASRIRNEISNVSQTQQNIDHNHNDCTKDDYTNRNETNNAGVNNRTIKKHFSCINIGSTLNQNMNNMNVSQTTLHSLLSVLYHTRIKHILMRTSMIYIVCQKQQL